VDAVAAAREVAAEVLAPAAAEVDRADTIPPGHLRALADAGLLALADPAAGVPPEARRTVTRHLAGACGATTFVWAQHAGVVARLAATDNEVARDRWFERCVSGESLAGTAFAHLRRPGPASLRARRDGGGWRLDGFAPWATSWGLAQVFSVAALTDDDHVLWAVVDGHEATGLRATAPLALSVMAATRTVELRFDDLAVPDDALLALQPVDEWRRQDRPVAARANPAILGVVDAAIALVAERETPEAADTVRALRTELGAWEEIDAADAASGATIGTLATHRAELLDLAGRATTAALSVVGGNAVLRDHPAQRLARERTFYVVQAQSGDGRAATLSLMRR
jgi:alkylation response protein AidB-like acyl-CoA dehydrogenase